MAMSLRHTPTLMVPKRKMMFSTRILFIQVCFLSVGYHCFLGRSLTGNINHVLNFATTEIQYRLQIMIVRKYLWGLRQLVHRVIDRTEVLDRFFRLLSTPLYSLVR